MAVFRASGKGQTPVAIIQEGTTPNEKIAIATVDTIEKEVYRNGLTNPAIILIGEVVRLREKIHSVWSTDRIPLANLQENQLVLSKQ